MKPSISKVKKFKDNANLKADNVIDVNELYDTDNLFEKISGFKVFQFHRLTANGKIMAGANRRHLLFISLVGMTIAIYFVVVSAVTNFKTGRMKEFQDSFVGVIGVLALTKNICLLLRFDDLMEIINQLDSLFPRTQQDQERMQMQQDHAIHMKGWYFKKNISALAVVLFCTMPFLIFALDSDRKNLRYDHFVIASDLPGGIKQDLRFYPFISIIEFYMICQGCAFMLAYDHIYKLQWYQILMHFKYINYEIEQLKVESTIYVHKAEKVFQRISYLLRYHRDIKE